MKIKSAIINIFIVIIFLISLSCSQQDKKITFVVNTKQGTKYTLLNDIVNHLKKKGYIANVLVIDDKQGKTTVEYLLDESADIAILENDFSEDTISKINSVLPLYPSIVMLLYNNKSKISSINELVKGQRISMYSKNNSKTLYAKKLLKEFSLSEDAYYPVYNSSDNNLISDSVKMCFYLTGYDNSKVVKMIKNGAKIFSFDDFNLANKGSSVDAFCIKHIYSYPFIIPKYLFGNYPDEPILTIAVDAVLVAREGISSELIYDLTKLIIEEKGILGQNNNNFGFITENFNSEKLKYPLHQGARDYFQRNEPSYIEKNIELIGLIITLAISFFGGIKSISLWNKFKKKNWINEYYRIVLESQAYLINDNYSIDELSNEITKLLNLKNEAYNKLFDNQLIADENFKIFSELLENTIKELKQIQKSRFSNVT